MKRDKELVRTKQHLLQYYHALLEEQNDKDFLVLVVSLSCQFNDITKLLPTVVNARFLVNLRSLQTKDYRALFTIYTD